MQIKVKEYYSMADWENRVLRQHPNAVFKDYGNTVVPEVKTGNITCSVVGLFCKGNMKGEIYNPIPKL